MTGQGSAATLRQWIDRGTATRRVAAAATLLAGGVHYAVVPGHRAEWWWLAVAFTVVGGSQLVWGVMAWRLTHRGLLTIGLALNAGAVIVWASSRIWGFPVAPHSGHHTGPGNVDLGCVAAELVAIAALGLVLNLWPGKSDHGSEPGG